MSRVCGQKKYTSLLPMYNKNMPHCYHCTITNAKYPICGQLTHEISCAIRLFPYTIYARVHKDCMYVHESQESERDSPKNNLFFGVAI